MFALRADITKKSSTFSEKPGYTLKGLFELRLCRMSFNEFCICNLTLSSVVCLVRLNR